MVAGFRQAVATTAALVCLCALPAAALADGYSQPTPIANNTLFTQASGAGVEANEPLTTMGDGLCGENGPEVQSTRWYSFRGTGGPMYVTSAGSNFDTLIGFYNAPAPAVIDGDTLCSNDRAANDADSQIELSTTTAGKQYLLQVGGCNDDLHPGQCPLDAQLRTGVAAFAAVGNDSRSFPEAVPAATPVTRTNAGASTEGGEPTTCGAAPLGKSVWFRYNATAAGRARFEAVGFDVVLGVYRGGRLACNDDTGDSNTSEVSLDVTPGVYLVQIAGKGVGEAATFGNFRYRVDFAAAPVVVPTVTPGPAVDLDRDNDGLNDDIDCDDDNPAINQRATEIRGNAVDEDCVGGPQDYERIAARYRYKTVRGHVVRFKFIRVFDIPAGATLRVTCRGKGCRGKKTYTRRFGKARGRFDLTTRAKRHRLRKGAVLELRVTSPRKIGRVFRIEALADGNSTDSDRCLRPGAKRTVRCRA